MTLFESIQNAYVTLFESIAAYHGTGQEFDKFDTSMVLSGEGVTKYGHGLYFTSSKAVANYYANRTPNGKVYSVKLFPGYNPHLWNLDDSVESVKADLIGICKTILGDELDEVISELQNNVDGYSDIDTYIEELIFNNNDTYNYENLVDSLDEDLVENPQELVDKFVKIISKVGFEFDAFDTVFSAYDHLRALFDSPQKASMFLKKYGIDGLEYTANELNGDATNYVIFDSSDVKIIEVYEKDEH